MSTAFNTRIKAKYDTYANWEANNPVPLTGELCVVVVPQDTDVVTQEPAILFKVGDGTSNFNALPFGAALAADVYNWAKTSAKPTYTADEISGLADYISGEINDSNTKYKLEQNDVDGHVIELYSREVGGEWVLEDTITTIDTVYDDTALSAIATAAMTAVAEKVASITAGDAISVDTTTEGTPTAPHISVKISTDAGNGLSLGTDGGLKATASQEADYTLTVDESTPEGYAKSYDFKQQGNTIATINIPKDMVVSSGEVLVKSEAGAWGAPGTYMALTLANAESTIIYIRVDELCDAYSVEGSSTQVQLAISASNEISATIVAGSIGLTELSAAVITELSKIHTHENATVLAGITAGKVTSWDDKQDALTVGVDYVSPEQLADVAESGDIADLSQEGTDYIILNCGSSSEII